MFQMDMKVHLTTDAIIAYIDQIDSRKLLKRKLNMRRQVYKEHLPMGTDGTVCIVIYEQFMQLNKESVSFTIIIREFPDHSTITIIASGANVSAVEFHDNYVPYAAEAFCHAIKDALQEYIFYV